MQSAIYMQSEQSFGFIIVPKQLNIKQDGREGGLLFPFPSKLFFSIPSSNPTIPACVAQI